MWGEFPLPIAATTVIPVAKPAVVPVGIIYYILIIDNDNLNIQQQGLGKPEIVIWTPLFYLYTFYHYLFLWGFE